MNSNFFHNLANIAVVVIAAVTAILTSTGCTTLADGSLECSASSWLSPELAATVIAVIGGVKILVNIFRDGITGLTKPQPPVEK